MVYCDYYYIYGFSTYNNETDIIDHVSNKMSGMDLWDLDTLTCTSSDANIEMLHAVYNYVEEEYSDADFRYEYYVNVTDIIYDENTGSVSEIVGEKVDCQTYETSEKALWNGEEITTLSIDDFEKIYSNDNLLERKENNLYNKFRGERQYEKNPFHYFDMHMFIGNSVRLWSKK